ncbi:Putative lumazine-binding [Kaistia soli DSM 19436]|uniref:Putative lumazine-binding n=1 Tax=Kaistia soli DSM 19436 TaxID=1122133 RepID=A0A1M5DZP5_9HYPH|nr:nuclear transport factor 2 family protein [Kaistia soli]SHF72292.1 Putative lumazine-binding [Kaistia soli DSM 19436]
MSQLSAATQEDLVLDVIGGYLKGLREGDKSILSDVFLEDAKVMHLSFSDEKFAISGVPELLELIDDLHKQYDYVEEIHSEPIVAVSGPVASVHVPFVVKLGSAEVKGTDVFALIKVADKWKIANKLYGM